MEIVAGAVMPSMVVVDDVVAQKGVRALTGLGKNTSFGGEVIAITAAPNARADAVISEAGRLPPGC